MEAHQERERWDIENRRTNTGGWGRDMSGDSCDPNIAHPDSGHTRVEALIISMPITIMPAFQSKDRRQDKADLDSSVHSSCLDHVPIKFLFSFSCPAAASTENTHITPEMSCNWNFS